MWFVLIFHSFFSAWFYFLFRTIPFGLGFKVTVVLMICLAFEGIKKEVQYLHFPWLKAFEVLFYTFNTQFIKSGLRLNCTPRQLLTVFVFFSPSQVTVMQTVWFSTSCSSQWLLSSCGSFLWTGTPTGGLDSGWRPTDVPTVSLTVWLSAEG